MMRTTILPKKLELFFQNLAYTDYDSLLSDIEKISLKAKVNDEIYRFTIYYILRLFEKALGPVMDEVFIYIAQKYFLAQQIYWNNPLFITKLEERVNEIIPTLTGTPGADLKMENINGEFINLHRLDAKLKVLIFWNTDCEHCKIAIPEIYKTTKKYKTKDVLVFAVYNGKEKEVWS
ncbi:MAG: redoxin domain-containing protein, partial [Bacteroidia bacterium]|nr:redoxin domain-containing protein [Bacteroidia bacterium]